MSYVAAKQTAPPPTPHPHPHTHTHTLKKKKKNTSHLFYQPLHFYGKNLNPSFNENFENSTLALL